MPRSHCRLVPPRSIAISCWRSKQRDWTLPSRGSSRTMPAPARLPWRSSRSWPPDRRQPISRFVVDRSGSMEGSSIEEVRNALQLCLRSMTAGCRFNIVGFGSTYKALFNESRVYDEASLAEASKYVAALDATLGGTEILPALQFVLGHRADRS